MAVTTDSDIGVIQTELRSVADRVIWANNNRREVGKEPHRNMASVEFHLRRAITDFANVDWDEE